MKIIRYIFIRHFYHISFIFNLTNHYFRSILYLLAELIYFDTVMRFHHRVTQSFTESYFLISNQLNSVRLCVTLWWTNSYPSGEERTDVSYTS